MRPLLEKELDSFLKRFDYFKDSELRSVEITSPTTIKITLAGQDSARGFDWITVEFELDSVSDAKLLESSKLSFVDMAEGISLLNEDNLFGFAIGQYQNLSGIKNATIYMISSSIKYKEDSF